MKHFTILGLFTSLFGTALGGCSGSSSHSVGGTADGVDGSGLVLLLNGVEQLPITASGSFEFTTAFSDGDAYAVTVETQPSCPQQVCEVTGGTGTIEGGDVVAITVTCAEPTYRLVTQSWGDDSLRITDDLLSHADGATATPRVVGGGMANLSNSALDSVAYDGIHDRIYVNAPGAILVFGSAAALAGDVAALHTISVASIGWTYQGIEVDAGRDRLYVTAGDRLLVFDDASTVDGEVVPAATIMLASAAAVGFDPVNDRLVVAGDYTGLLQVFDDASTITSASTPDRTVTWADAFGPATVSIDGCTDRLYVGSNDSTTGGYEVIVFDGASTLGGAVDLEMDSDAQLDVGECISSRIDGSGRLYCLPDSATYVDIYDDAAAFTGNVAPTPSRTILGVVNEGYGMDVAGL